MQLDPKTIERLEAELADVRAAIKAVLGRGQAVSVHSRDLTRARLAELEAREARLEQKLARARRGGVSIRQAVPRG